MKRTDGSFPVWEIIPGQLYQRGKMFPRFSPELKLQGLAHYGITHAVALAPPKPDPDLEAWGNADIIGYTHFPIPDGLLHTQPQLLELASDLADEITAGGCVLTMCNAGRNRSGLLSALIVRELLGLSGIEAVEHVQLHRPRALANPGFVEFLLQLPATEKKIYGK